MHNFWVPEITPPQLSREAYENMSLKVLEHGIHDVAHKGLADLQTQHEPFAEYLDRLGFALNNISTEGLWPERTLKIGAAIALLGYQESGYFHLVDQTALEIGTLIAELEGIPEAFSMSFALDGNLVELLDTTHDAPDFKADQGGYAQVLRIGAGCTRHYMQQAIAA